MLETGLDSETLAICIKLCENGVNPEALAMVIQELRRESAALKVSWSPDLLLQRNFSIHFFRLACATFEFVS